MMKGGEQGAVLSILTALQTPDIVSSQTPLNSTPHIGLALNLAGLCVPDKPGLHLHVFYSEGRPENLNSPYTERPDFSRPAFE